MATISGKSGTITVSNSAVAEITGWSLTTTSNNPAYASNATSGHKTRRGGVKDFTGTADYVYDTAADIHDTLATGNTVTLVLSMDGTENISCPSIIDSITYNVDINDGGIVGGVVSFSATAAPTLP